MKKDGKLFVRIDYKSNCKKIKSNVYNQHLDYIENIVKDRLLLGGGFKQQKGGMIIFKAESRAEAEEITKNDPIIKNDSFSYNLYEWDLLISSKEIQLK